MQTLWQGDSATGACWGEQFNYDPWGNLTAISPVSSAYTGCTQENWSMSATLKNQLQDTSNDYVYDAAGNLIQPGPLGGPYVFDAENHLISAGGMAYLYDGDGKRVGKAPGSTPTQPNYLYWYGLGSQILEETDGAGNYTYRDFYFNGQLLARAESDWVDHFFTDALGNVRAVYGDGDPDGGTSEYYPFGGERPISNGSNTTGVGVPFKFTGKERDSESGLDNFGARYDSSQYGRFMTPDPVTITTERLYDPQQLNAYAYVRNNPLRFNDPTGEILQCTSASTDDDQAAKDRQQCFNDLKTIAGDAASRLSMDKTGLISLDTTGLDLSKNEGASLVNDLVGSKNTYDFSIGPTVMTDKGPVRVDYLTANLPTFGDQPKGGNPPSGVSDIVALYFNNPNLTQVSNTNLKVAPEWAVAFHELAEAYEKIDGGKGGSYEQGHNAALQREMMLRDQRPYLKEYNTGAGGPANSPNPQGGIIIKR